MDLARSPVACVSTPAIHRNRNPLRIPVGSISTSLELTSAPRLTWSAHQHRQFSKPNIICPRSRFLPMNTSCVRLGRLPHEPSEVLSTSMCTP